MESLGASLPVSRLRDKLRKKLTGQMISRKQRRTADKRVKDVRVRFTMINSKHPQPAKVSQFYRAVMAA